MVIPRQKAIFEQGKLAFLINLNLEKATDGREETRRSAYPLPSEGERLLGSFRTRKAAEWKESWKHSARADFSGGDKLEEIFVLTRKLLINAVGVLSDRFIQNDSLLEKALREVYHRLPLMIRLILWKKRYLQFILANRERLIP